MAFALADCSDSPRAILQGRLMEIRNVWSENLELELANMRKLVDKYCYVAMVRGTCG